MENPEEKIERSDNLWLFCRRLSFEEIVGTILMIGISVTMGLGVFFRYVLNNSLTWTEEISRYGLIYATFIGCSIGIRHRSHIRIDFIDLIIPEKVKKVLKVLNEAICLAFFIYMAYKAYQIIEILHTTKSTALQIPMSYIYIVILIGFILGSARLIAPYLFKPRQEGNA